MARPGMSHIGGRSWKVRCLELELKLRLCRRAAGRSVRRGPGVIHNVGIIMNGVTGRMGLNQHLRRSIFAMMQQGGVRLSESEWIMPKPLLMGRNAVKLAAISKECGGLDYSTDLETALADPSYSIYFDAQTTDRRAECVKKA